jgi:membrane peptidoglycan carboxypeptidase
VSTPRPPRRPARAEVPARRPAAGPTGGDGPPPPAQGGALPGRHGLFWRARKILFVMAFLLFTALAGSAYALSRVSLPPPFHQDETTTLLDANGKPIAYLSGSTNRQPVSITQVPQHVIDAVIATEDHNFYHHHGVDPGGIFRAAVNDLLGRGNLQGASTLTQQYVKNAYLGQQRTLSRKIKEAVLALKLERQLTKQQILERYLNTIYFGRGAYGIQAASQAYFHVNVQSLNLSQAAFLAGVIRAPEYADPTRDGQGPTRRDPA